MFFCNSDPMQLFSVIRGALMGAYFSSGRISILYIHCTVSSEKLCNSMVVNKLYKLQTGKNIKGSILLQSLSYPRIPPLGVLS